MGGTDITVLKNAVDCRPVVPVTDDDCVTGGLCLFGILQVKLRCGAGDALISVMVNIAVSVIVPRKQCVGGTKTRDVPGPRMSQLYSVEGMRCFMCHRILLRMIAITMRTRSMIKTPMTMPAMAPPDTLEGIEVTWG